MGKCETAKSCLGLKFTLEDLKKIVNNTNVREIFETILFSENIYIKDENNCFNTNFYSIKCRLSDATVYDMATFHEFIYECQYNGDIEFFTSGSKHVVFNEYSKDTDCLYNQEFIFTDYEISSVSRWGYDRDGSNVDCIDFFDLTNMKNKLEQTFKRIGFKDYTVVFTTILQS